MIPPELAARLARARQETERRPQDSAVHAAFGAALIDAGRPDEALAAAGRAIALDPDDPAGHHVRGSALIALLRYAEALEPLRRAIALRPSYARTWSNLGLALRKLGNLSEALEAFETGLALEPLKNIEVNLACTELMLGRFDSGWTRYERRGDFGAYRARRAITAPVWDGAEPVDGKTVLVSAELGLGDSIQFCRYLPLLAARGAKVLFSPQPALDPLMKSLGGGVEIVDDRRLGDRSPDWHIRLLSLPRVFGTRIDSIPAKVPYLFAEPARVQNWRKRLGPEGFKVGVCWRGSADGTLGGLSFSLDDLAETATMPGVRLISLQRGAEADQKAALAARPWVESHIDYDALDNRAFSQTAALISACDLVISADTAIAHLSGALGKPTFVVMPVEGDWRWLTGRADTPWYPGMRLFRPSLEGGRAGVFEAMTKALRSTAEAFAQA